MAEYPQVTTVRDRLIRANVAPHNATRGVVYGKVTVDGRSVTDPAAPVAEGSVVVLHDAPSPPVTA